MCWTENPNGKHYQFSVVSSCSKLAEHTVADIASCKLKCDSTENCNAINYYGPVAGNDHDTNHCNNHNCNFPENQAGAVLCDIVQCDAEKLDSPTQNKHAFQRSHYKTNIMDATSYSVGARGMLCPAGTDLVDKSECRTALQGMCNMATAPEKDWPGGRSGYPKGCSWAEDGEMDSYKMHWNSNSEATGFNIYLRPVCKGNNAPMVASGWIQHALDALDGGVDTNENVAQTTDAESIGGSAAVQKSTGGVDEHEADVAQVAGNIPWKTLCIGCDYNEGQEVKALDGKKISLNDCVHRCDADQNCKAVTFGTHMACDAGDASRCTCWLEYGGPGDESASYVQRLNFNVYIRRDTAAPTPEPTPEPTPPPPTSAPTAEPTPAPPTPAPTAAPARSTDACEDTSILAALACGFKDTPGLAELFNAVYNLFGSQGNGVFQMALGGLGSLASMKQSPEVPIEERRAAAFEKVQNSDWAKEQI